MLGRVVPMPTAIPDNARLGGVLCLLFPVNGILNVLLMKRMEDGTAHSGQVSFPGGSKDPEDTDLTATALREAEEEVGIPRRSVQVLGALTSLYIPVSNFMVFPTVGFVAQLPPVTLSRNEVARTFEVPLDVLFHPGRKFKKDVVSPANGMTIKGVNAYVLPDETVIWGATAMILSELETIFDEMGTAAR
jgi:8-oxo-dGTP pyrophosphatase MutT (NUDIX family)